MRKYLVVFPIGTVIIMWFVYGVQALSGFDFGVFGIHPRDTASLLGILTCPLVHGSWEHLLSNTLPLLVFGVILFLSYEKFAIWIWLLNYFFTGLLVWLFARDSFHIGASGIIYGLASFLFFSGFFRFDIKAIAIASGVAIFYGGMIWGILPTQPGVSWESHLFGGITGGVLAYLFKNVDKDQQHAQIEAEHQRNVENRKTFDDFIKKI
ncbi:MAG: rhomboid family intramembrane serine protease [Chitinophagales bacterium]